MLAAMSWGQWTLAALITFTCFLLMIVILLQKGRGGGLAGAFGGAGGSSAFGAKTGDVFTWITVVGAAVFVVLVVMGNYAFDQSATAKPPTAEIIPIDGTAPPEDGAAQPIPIKVGGNIELGTTDPVTGETKTTIVPVDGVPIEPKAAEPAPSTAGEAGKSASETPVKPESKPEGSPEEKPEEKAPSKP